MNGKQPNLHRHHHQEMDASEFKRKSLNSIKRRKQMAIVTKTLIVVTAIFMLLAIVFVLFIDK